MLTTTTQGRIAVELDSVRPLKGQPRQHFDLDGLKQLAASIRAVGQLVPATVRKLYDEAYEYELIDWERRWRACRMADIKTLWIIVAEDFGDPEQHFELSAISNFCRVNLSHLEVAHIVQWFANHRDYTIEEIAKRLGCTTGWVYQLQAITRLSPAVQKLMHPSLPEKKRLKFTIAYEIAKRVPQDKPDLQLELAQSCVTHKLRIAQARTLIAKRTKGLGTAPQPRMPRPDKALHGFLSFVDRLETDLDVHDRSFSDIQRMLSAKEPTTVRMTLGSLRKSAARLTKLTNALEGVRK